MNTITRIALVSGMSVATLANAQTLVEAVNDDLPLDLSWSATRGHEQAFRWTPNNSFDLIQILWRTSPIAEGVIRLRVDTGGAPGAVLREVAFSSGTSGWNGAPFDEPYPVEAGQSYFVTFQSLLAEYREFVAQDGPGALLLPMYWSPTAAPPWNGPFTDPSTRRPIRFFEGAPSCYADLDGDGVLTIFDFLEFQNLFDAGDLTADCDDDGDLTIFDFLCYQNAFDAGCA